MPKRPSMYELWVQSGEDPVRYRELLHEHGAILYPGDEGYEDAPRNLPCGWPGNRGQALLEHLDEFCLYCLAGDCGSCEGGPCECAHEAATGTEPG